MLFRSEDQQILRDFVEKHFQYTTSGLALMLIEKWGTYIGQFVKVMPQDFKKALASRGISLSQQIADKNVVYQDITVEVGH